MVAGHITGVKSPFSRFISSGTGEIAKIEKACLAAVVLQCDPSEVSMEATLDSLIRQYESGRMTRRDLIASLVFLAGSCAVADDLDSLYRATELNHVTIRVTNLKRSKEFYQHLLGLPVMQEDDQICYLKSGTGFLCLVQTGKETPPGFDHLCFGIGAFDRTVGMAKLSTTGLPLRHDPGDPDTIYVLDPDNTVCNWNLLDTPVRMAVHCQSTS
jgi:catechol 2,3-dioxygenase-like lactoylglutathione lyase family enzyme